MTNSKAITLPDIQETSSIMEQVVMAVGTVSRADKIGWKGRYKVICVACINCGILRWAMFIRQPQRCSQCNGKRAIIFANIANSKPRPYQSERQKGARNPSWKGGVIRGGRGYIYELVPSDDSLRCMANKMGYAMQHRLVMARAIGRALTKWEQVHHKNGNRTDNRLENLELWKHSQPSGIRQADYHCPGCQCFTEAHHD